MGKAHGNRRSHPTTGPLRLLLEAKPENREGRLEAGPLHPLGASRGPGWGEGLFGASPLSRPWARPPGLPVALRSVSRGRSSRCVYSEEPLLLCFPISRSYPVYGWNPRAGPKNLEKGTWNRRSSLFSQETLGTLENVQAPVRQSPPAAQTRELPRVPPDSPQSRPPSSLGLG